MVANRTAIGGWETFLQLCLPDGLVAFQASNGQYVCAEGGGGGQVVANRNSIGGWESFNLGVPK